MPGGNQALLSLDRAGTAGDRLGPLGLDLVELGPDAREDAVGRAVEREDHKAQVHQVEHVLISSADGSFPISTVGSSK